MSLSVNYSFEGEGNWSLDGTSGTAPGPEAPITVDVPEGSEVEAAFLYATTYSSGSSNQVTLSSGDDSSVVASFQALGLTGAAQLQAFRADVTTFVASIIGDGGSDQFSFNISNIVGTNVDGYMLAVVYSNPDEEYRTIKFLDGYSASSGDSFSVDFEEPVDTDQAGFEALLSLGIGFGFQSESVTDQFSQVVVGDRLLTDIAGGQDDGLTEAGGLITVGGIGDASANPPDPSAAFSGSHLEDDELYDLAQGNAANPAPFLQDGAESILIQTLNPSNDDNIFFAGLNVTAAASVSIPDNSPPTANPDTDTIDENAAGSFDVVANDTDPDTVDTLTVASLGDITVVSDNEQVDGIGLAGFFNFDGGSISYDFSGEDTVFDPLGSGETATVTVNYTVQDGNGGTDSSTLTLTVNGVNDAPEAVDDFFGYGPSSEEIGGVVEDPLSGHAYYFNEAYLSWEAARDAAESLGGHLATIPWFEENTFIYETFIQPLEGGDDDDWTPWIGASDAAVEGEWRWVTGPEAGFQFWQGNASGTPLGFDNWSPGQPDDNELNEDYAEMWPGGAWNDAPGEGGHFSIVEFSPPNEDSTTAISENFILDNDGDPEGSDLNLAGVDEYSEFGAEVWFDEEAGTVSYDPRNAESIQALSLGEYAEDTFQYTVSDGELTDSATVHVKVWGRNDAPVIDLDGPDEEPEETAFVAVEASETLDYTEGDPPTQIAPDATVSDVDTEDFSGGSLTVSFSANGTEDDVLGIENQGNGDGEIGVVGDDIYYQGFFIGTADEPGGSLVVDFDDAGSEGVSVDAVQALIRAIVFSNELDDPSTDPRTVLFTLDDGDGTGYGGADTGVAAATINVIADNAAPTSTNDKVTTAEDTARILSLDDFGAYDDPDSTPIAAVKITALETDGSLEYDTTGEGDWAPVTLDQEISATDITDERLRFVPDANENGSPYATIGFRVGDGSDFSAAAYTLTVDVTQVNDAPAATIVPASYAATEQVALSLKNNGLSVSDPDAGNAVVTTVLSVTQGILNVTAGTSGAEVFASGTSAVTIYGTLAQINALLNTDATSTVSYINNSDTPAASATLTLEISDRGNTGSGGIKIASDNAAINVALVNDAPGATIAPASYAATEQVALSLKNNGLSVADPDAGNAVVTTVLSVTQGILNVTAGTSGAEVFASGTSAVTIYGTLAQINALLNTDATSTVSYVNNSDTPAASATLTLEISDRGNTGSGGIKIASDNAAINVALVNDAPVVIAPASYAATEQVALSLKNNGLSVSDADAGNAVVIATLSTSQGQLTVTAGTSGAAVSGSGTHTVTITGTLAQINALLNSNATSTVSYVNNSNTPAPAAGLTLSVNDQGNSGSGGAKIGSDTAVINVAAVNDAPVAAPDSAGVNEGASVSGNVIAGAAGGAGRDSDVDGTSLSIKGVVFWKEGGGSAGPGAALNGQFGTLVLQANGSYTYTANPNSSALVAGETGIDRFVYTLVDAGGATSTATLTVSGTRPEPGHQQRQRRSVRAARRRQHHRRRRRQPHPRPGRQRPPGRRRRQRSAVGRPGQRHDVRRVGQRRPGRRRRRRHAAARGR